MDDVSWYRGPPTRLLLVALGLLAFAGLAGSVSSADPKTPAGKAVDSDHAARMAKGLEIFKQHVRPILTEHCLKCHGGKKVEGEFDLTDRQGLLRGGATGPAVVAGSAQNSLLYQLITHAQKPHMPRDGKLPGEAIVHIAAWIDHGAPYDQALVPGKADAPSWTQKIIAAESRRFWSFQPLRRVEPPKVRNETWCRTPVDRFILAKLEAAGLAPNPSVDHRPLIRRAYFDLIGLPPSPAEVDAFVNDPAVDTYEKLLDRLLHSPHYGERWARHWLDLARFAESHGFEHDYDRPSAYHYRDFVIRALNDDLPYDTFVRWQLAGDEFAPDNNLALTATGFLAAGVHSTQITQREVERQRYDELDDILSTVGTSMLGLTVGCARCHDHKFDPIPQRDYYRLLAAFTTTVRSEIDLDLDPAGYRKAKAQFDRAHAPYVAALRRFEADQLPAHLADWETTWQIRQEQFPWTVLDLFRSKSQGGSTFTPLDDGSVRVGGKNPKFDTYTLVAHTDLTGITAVRLEALADESLVKGGPGRAANGNFALTDFRLTAVPVDGKQQPAQVRLRNPRATFEQKGLPVRAAIDNDPRSAWAVDPELGKDHAAVFETEAPVGFRGGTVLTFTLQFKNNTGHGIGRPRLSATCAQAPVALRADGIPERIAAILPIPADRRSEAQKAALLKWYGRMDPEARKLHQRAQDHLRDMPKPRLDRALIASEGLPAIRLHTQGADFFNETYFLRRGDADQKEGVATPGFLQVLTTAPELEKHWQPLPPKGWRTSYRRRALAEWITDVDRGAGALLARVIVNRLWQHHMGRGIVATASDFGTRGEPPSHPELLEWLAAELIRNGWRLQPIHKLIMSSAVYRQSAQIDEASARVDRENRLFWRRPRHRLEAEVVRDALLAVSGTLDPTLYGPGTLDEASRRRSVYFTVKRSKLQPMMQVFDAPDALQGIGERSATTVAPQALLLMNNPQVRFCARQFARRAAPTADTPLEEAIRSAYRIALAREPDADELTDAVAFVNIQGESHHAANRPNAQELALADFCQTLMCLNEFIYLD